MRTHRLVVAGLLVAAGIGIHALPAHAANEARLTVNPGRGNPDVQFTATYRFPKQTQGCPSVPFQWDGRSEIGRVQSEANGDSCVATLHTTPPRGSYSGNSNHFISANSGNGQLAFTTYTVTAPPAQGPSSPTTPPGNGTGPGPAPGPGTPAPSAVVPGASGTATPGRTSSAAAAAAAAQVPGQAEAMPGSDPGSGAETGAGGQAAGKDGTSSTGWLIVAGIVLFLIGAGAFGVMVWRARRSKLVDGVDPDSGVQPENTMLFADPVLLSPADVVTQQLPAVAQPGAQKTRAVARTEQPTARIAQPEQPTAPITQPEPPAVLAEQAKPVEQAEAQTAPAKQAEQPQPRTTPPVQRKPEAAETAPAPLAQRKP
ncbi:MAG TPA: hypothetical protein VGP31_05860 [Planosporangium sp.]|nr:hypothetical protein [Planosporangium sp.]